MAQTIIESKDSKMAVLIDGDNAQASLLNKMLAEIAKHGSVTIRRIYGDWTTQNMHSWKDALHMHAVQPIQQFRYTVGKNATDSALIIDAMDILHSKLADGFCLVSSDSDYTRLATRIRETGFFVMGIGQLKTPKPFVNACNLFIYTENLMPPEAVRRTTGGRRGKKEEVPVRADPLPLLRKAFDMAVEENGWAKMGSIGMALPQLDPGFDPRTYGCRQLSQLFKPLDKYFELRYLNETDRVDVLVKSRE
jgi:hypothetical protein